MESQRQYDPNDFLHIKRTHILKEGVFPYYGSEVPDGDALGLEPDKLYQFYRPWDEIEKAAESFARLPILNKHVPVGAATIAELMQNAVGAYGSDIVAERPYLDSDLALWTAEAIAGVESKQVQEFSSAYRWKPVITKGEFEGIPYDGLMTDLKGNHSAQVPESRNGPDMIAADAKPKERQQMAKVKMTKLGAAMYVSLKLTSPKLAMDAALPTLCARMTKRNTNPVEFKRAVLAMDSDLAPENVDDVVDALLEVDNSPEPIAADSPNDEKRGKLSSLLQGKVEDDVLAQILAIACDETVVDPGEQPAMDNPPAPEGPEGGASKPGETVTKPAMDAALAQQKKDITELYEARDLVKPVVGEVIAMDSAVGVMNFALDHMKVKRDGVTTFAGLKTLFVNAREAEIVAKPRFQIAQDEAIETAKKFNLARFK